jgi:hypothetical protein
MQNTLLLTLLLPALATVPFVYLLGKKSAKTAAFLIAFICIVDIALLSTLVPTILNGARPQVC